MPAIIAHYQSWPHCKGKNPNNSWCLSTWPSHRSWLYLSQEAWPYLWQRAWTILVVPSPTSLAVPLSTSLDDPCCVGLCNTTRSRLCICNCNQSGHTWSWDTHDLGLAPGAGDWWWDLDLRSRLKEMLPKFLWKNSIVIKMMFSSLCSFSLRATVILISTTYLRHSWPCQCSWPYWRYPTFLAKPTLFDLFEFCYHVHFFTRRDIWCLCHPSPPWPFKPSSFTLCEILLTKYFKLHSNFLSLLVYVWSHKAFLVLVTRNISGFGPQKQDKREEKWCHWWTITQTSCPAPQRTVMD